MEKNPEPKKDSRRSHLMIDPIKTKRRIMNRYIKTFAFITIAIASLSIYAQPNENRPPHREDPCKAERQAYCKTATPGPDSDRCLKDSLGKLSESCKNHILEMLARFEKIKAACGADEEKFCKNSETHRDKMACMKEHESVLSSACKAALPRARPSGS